MDYIADVFLCSITSIGLLIGVFILALFVQFICYRIFNFNLYKWINYILFEKEWNI